MSKDSALTNLELTPSDANVMVRFVGELNENLKFVEKNFNVKIFQNGNNLKIQGSNKDVGLAMFWHNGSAAKTAFLGFDDSAGKLTFIPDASISSEVHQDQLGLLLQT